MASGTVEPLGDLWNAKRFAEDHSVVARYARGLGWRIWDGGRWAPSTTGREIRLARDTLCENFRRATASGDRDRIRFATNSTNEHKLRAMLSLAESEPGIATNAAAFDADPWLLNTLSGTVDLRTGKLADFDTEQLITKSANAFYYEDATCPRWLTFLDEIFGHNLELIDYAQRALGYAATADTSEQCLFFLWGSGANGKSTLIETVKAVLGDYSTQCPVDTLMARRDGGIGNDIARLHGARFVSAVETAEGRRLNEALIKRLTGEDTLAARFLYKEHFEFRPSGKLFIATNHKPTVTGTDHAIWRRIRLIPFTVTFPPKDQDRHLREKLLAESAGILRWIVEGAMLWQRNGLRDPREVNDATEGYRRESDSLAPFIEACCVTGPNVEGIGLYRAYQDWANASGERAMSARDFSTRLAEKGYPPGRNARGRFFQGIGLLTENEGMTA